MNAASMTETLAQAPLQRSRPGRTRLAILGATLCLFLSALPKTADAAVTQKPSKAVAMMPVAKPIQSYGFNAQMWTYTIADPWGAYRQYYYNMCRPKRNVRFFKMKSSWIYTTYECWAILS